MPLEPTPAARRAMPCEVLAYAPGGLDGPGTWTLHGREQMRALEHAAAAGLPPHTLMRRAGLATARLALALAPQARRIWIAAGPGNNGGDGLEAAIHLHAAGREVTVSHLATTVTPADAAASLQRAREAGVRIVPQARPPEGLDRHDLAIDALLGLGASRPPGDLLAEAIDALNAGSAPVLALDLPSGLHPDHGTRWGEAPAVRAAWTLSFLGLKPGLFTAEGRDHAGQVWLDDLGVDRSGITERGPNAAAESVHLLTNVGALWPKRQHVHHKGSFGDTWVVGGAPGMTGAAALAARAALAAGAGRVYAVQLDETAPATDPSRPELMHRPSSALRDASVALERATVVCGCGGGDTVRAVLPVLLSRASRLLLDADALNALATDPALRSLLGARRKSGRQTLMTPHPLEAARLLACSTAEVQADRLRAASELAHRLGGTVVLKGSGTVIACPQGPRWINATGNASLASPGTGDVLAGWIGGLWSQGLDAAAAACLGVHSHGAAADEWRQTGRGHGVHGPLLAQDLIGHLQALRRA